MATKHKNAIVQIGDRLSEATSRLFAHPYMQVGVLLFCASWFALGFADNLLTAALSVVAITLTQMVLNGQYARETEAHRRDIAMHAKLDELIMANRRARDEMAGIEELEEEEIRMLTDQAKDVIDGAGDRVGNPEERESRKANLDAAAQERSERQHQRRSDRAESEAPR
jgi:low affinity Fe/Cu permease